MVPRAWRPHRSDISFCIADPSPMAEQVRFHLVLLYTDWSTSERRPLHSLNRDVNASGQHMTIGRAPATAFSCKMYTHRYATGMATQRQAKPRAGGNGR